MGNTKARRLVAVFENCVFAVVRMEAGIPYVLHVAVVLHQSTVLRVLWHWVGAVAPTNTFLQAQVLLIRHLASLLCQ